MDLNRKLVSPISWISDCSGTLCLVSRFTSLDTLVETVVLSVQVEDSGSGLVELGATPLVVPDFFGLSNAINASVLNIRTPPDVVCTVRLMTGDADVPIAGQLVRGDNGQRKGTPHDHTVKPDPQQVKNQYKAISKNTLKHVKNYSTSPKPDPQLV